jgi:hypothetical protein
VLELKDVWLVNDDDRFIYIEMPYFIRASGVEAEYSTSKCAAHISHLMLHQNTVLIIIHTFSITINAGSFKYLCSST